MDAIQYASGVKNFQERHIQESLLTLKVAIADILGNVERMSANRIGLERETDQWIVTKGLLKFLRNAGLPVDSYTHVVEASGGAAQLLIPTLEKLVKGYNEKVWDGKLMTVKQLNILNVIDYLQFWVKFTNMAMDVLLTMKLKSTTPEAYLDKVDLRWVNGTEQFYRQFSADLLKGVKHMTAELEKIPDVEASAHALDVLEGSGASTDLLKKGFGVHLLNPVFWFSLGWSKINLARIEKMRRENELFAMKISQLINKQNGSNDPALERNIEIYQNEIIKNNNTIESIEAQYA